MEEGELKDLIPLRMEKSNAKLKTAEYLLRIREDKSIVIPEYFMKRYRLIPKQQIEILEEKDGLRITKKRQDVYDKFVELLGEGLKGVEWRDIEAWREDRCF